VYLAHVSSNIAKDVATDATTNNFGLHTNVGNAIAAVVKEKLQKVERKSTGLHTTCNPTIADPEEVPMHAMEDNDEGQPKIESIMNVFFKQCY